MARATILVICLLGLVLSTQAINVYVGNATGLVCNNETVKVECDNTTQTKLYPNVCCNFGAGAVCCKEIPDIIGAIIGGVVACCLLCLLLPLLIIMICCCCLGMACCGTTSSKMRIVRPGYQRM